MLHHLDMNPRSKPVSLSCDERLALEAICRRRKVDALVWKRARALLLLDAGEDAGTVCRVLDIGPSVLPEWQFEAAVICVRIFIDVINPLRIERGCTPFNTVNFIAFFKQEFGQIRPVLASDASD